MVQPKKGDIIRFKRGVYDHFGIYIGDGKIIHRMYTLGGFKKTKVGILVDRLEDVAGDITTAEIANYLDGEITPFPPDEIVERAMSKLGEEDYNVVFQNCEHFVTWCRYGVESSKQADRFKALIGLVSPTLFPFIKSLYLLRKLSAAKRAYQ